MVVPSRVIAAHFAGAEIQRALIWFSALPSRPLSGCHHSYDAIPKAVGGMRALCSRRALAHAAGTPATRQDRTAGAAWDCTVWHCPRDTGLQRLQGF